jgi:predicted NBD/HSP70 family sugar kinase
MPKASRDLMRDLNTNLVVNLIKTSGSISRAELARQTQLSPATISGIVGRLVRIRIVSEAAVGPSKLGRPPVLLRLNDRAGYVMGIKVKEEGLTTVITDLGARVIYSRESDAALVGDPGAAIVAIGEAVRQALRESRVPRKSVLGVGIGLGGVTDASQGICRYSHILNWRDVPLRDPLRERLKMPVWVDNDVNCLAVAEKWFGAGVGLKHFLTVTVGRGIGLGIVVNGEIFRGALGGAGEFGHLIVSPDGPRCQCGRSGCLEAMVSEPALRTRAGLLLGRPITSEQLVTLTEAGDPAIRTVLQEGGRQLGLALANLVTLLNPERLIVSGEGTRLGPAFFDAMKEVIREKSFASMGLSLDVVVQPWGDEAWAVGAATLVLRELFSLNVGEEQHSLPQRLAG